MNTTTITTVAVTTLTLFYLVYNWVVIYNKFQYWIARVKRKFADIDVIMQQRVDLIQTMAQVVKKYDIHEYKALKDVIEARSRWTKDADINEKVKAAQEIESNFIKIQALVEKYPKLKASVLHLKLMGRSNLSRVESRLREARLGYNRIVEKYNERVNRFPRNIVAWIHRFKEFEYLNLTNQEAFNPKEIFND